MACNPNAPCLTIPACIISQCRLVTYQLRVIQQPERARACGFRKSGCIISDIHGAFADHRFIDPPPVVQFRAVETFPCLSASENDVTSNYQSQFFLLNTIEPLHSTSKPLATRRLF
ncbi:sexual development activator VeA [Penicillium frequentans]|nr:sexual development activator VeA [Penicillium glabrum]